MLTSITTNPSTITQAGKVISSGQAKSIRTGRSSTDNVVITFFDEMQYVISISDGINIDGSPYVPANQQALIVKITQLFPNGKSSSAGSGEVALTDASTIDLTASKQTLASSASSRTFTVSYTGDEITLRVTLSAATATYTFPSGALCVSEGVSSGSNAMIISGTSGDKYIIVIKKMTNIYYVVSKNFSR